MQSGHEEWTIDATDASDGTYSARSGVITHSQISSISTSAVIPYLPGTIQFSYKTSTEANYDELRFYKNGDEIAAWDGIHEWTDTTFTLTPGSYTFKWEYYKDGSCTCNCNSALEDLCSDAVWIDNIVITGYNIVVDAGEDISIDFIHDAIPGGAVQFDGTNTYPDEESSLPSVVWFQGQMKWYTIDDLDNVLLDIDGEEATGPNPTILLDCNMSDDIANMCIGEHEIVLKIALPTFGGFEEMDTVNVSITEPNQIPILTATSVVDTVSIPNINGNPGNPTSVNLMGVFSDQVEFSDPDVQSDGTEDPLSLVWSDSDGNVLPTPIQSVTAGDYTYSLAVIDPYGSTAHISLDLTMIEVNETPTVTIAVINESDIGLNQNSIENQEVFLYGFVEDEDNCDGSCINGGDVNFLWVCTQDGNPVTVTNETSINTSFISPLVSSNSETETVSCALQAADLFQVIDETSSTSESINITIYNDNQPPVIDISTISKPSLNEGGSLEVMLTDLISNNFISVSDIDNDQNFTLEVDLGDNYILDNSTVIPVAEFYGEISVPIRVDDGFIFADELYNNLSEWAYLIIDVIGINDPPILVGPTNSATAEGVDIEIIGISVSDADIDGIINDARLQFDISAENGTMSLSGDLGLIFASDCDCDGSDDAILSFTANPSNFNNAVSNLIFHPFADFLGDGQINIIVNDEGNIGIPADADPTELTDSHTIDITIDAVNDPPELIFPTLNSSNEDTDLIISGISIVDEDVADDDMEIQLFVNNGVITLTDPAELEFNLGDGYSDASLIFSGSISDISSAINPLTFIPNQHFNGEVELQVEANDLGGNGCCGPLSVNGNLLFTIDAVNDNPTAGDDNISVYEDGELISNVIHNDYDIDSSTGISPETHFSLTVHSSPLINVTNGVLNLSTNGVYTYEPTADYFGSDFFVYQLLDGAGGSAQGTVNITVNGVNDAPILTIPTDKYTEEDTPIDISGIFFSDIDIGDSDMKMDINTENSFISLGGETDGLAFISGDGENDSQLSFTGTKTNILNATTTITFTPEENYNGEVLVEIIISDIVGNGSGDVLFDSGEFTVTILGVNDPPGITFPGDQSGDEDDPISIYGVSVSDLDAIESTNEVQITISSDNGFLSLPYTTLQEDNVTFILGDGSSDSEMIFLGLIPDINELLNGMNFYGNPDYNGQDTITFHISDLGNTGLGDTLQQEIKMGIYLNAINDPPVNQLNNGEDAPPQISVIGTEITATPGSWNDVIDTDISLTSANITFIYQWQRNSINCSDGLYYSGCNDDGGNFLVGDSCGLDGECQLLEDNWVNIIEENMETYEIKNIDAQKYIRIEVTATDDGVGLPLQQSTIAFSDFHYVDNSAPIPQNIGYNIYEDNILTEDAPGILINDSDPDADAISAEVVTYPENGEVNLNLNGSFIYTPDEHFNGIDQFEYRINDGALYGDENAIVTITVSPVNDMPTFIIDGNVEISENFGTVELFEWATDIDDGDPELTQGLEFTLIALNPDLFEVQPTIDIENGTLSFSIFDNLNGNSDVTISLKDNGGLENGGVDETELSQFNVNIIPVNDEPYFTSGGDIIVLEDSGDYSQELWATNMNDGDPELVQELSFSIVSNTNQLLFSDIAPPFVDSSGKITFTIADDKSGVATIVIALLDGPIDDINTQSSDNETFTISVEPVNDAPQWSMGGNIVIIEDAGTQNFLDHITEIDDGDQEVNQELTFNLIDVSNPSLFSEPPSIDETGTLTFLVNDDLNGSSLVYFTLSDDGGTDNGGVDQTSQQFFEIEVLAVNDSPAFGIDAPGELVEDDFSVVEIIVTPEIPPNDEGNQSVQYTLSSLEAINDNGVLFANLSIEPSTGNVTINPIEHGNGEDIFTIFANDGSGIENGGIEIYALDFTYKVNDINDPPVNVELPLISGNGFIDSLLTVSDGLWSDSLDTFYSGNSEITYAYRWERADNNIEPLVNLTTIGNAVFNEYEVSQADYHKFVRVKVIATDDGPGDIGLDSFVYTNFIEILNTPPIAVDDSYIINEDLQLEVDFEIGLLLGWTQGDECVRFDNVYVSDCDRDGDALIVSLADSVSFGELALNQDGSFTYIPDTNKNQINMNITDNVEIDQFTYTIFDGESSSLPARVSITVNPVNDAPIFELTNIDNEVINSVDVYEDFETQHVFVLPGLVPPDETEQNVEYVISPESITAADISINSETGEIIIESILDLYETVQFTVIATDNGGTELEGIDEYSYNFVLDIIPVNDVPSFVKGDDQLILEDGGQIIVPSWATDISKGPINENSQALSFLVTTDNDAFFKDSQVPIINGISGSLTYQIADDLNGNVQVSLSLKDDGMVDQDNDGTDDFGGIDESEIQTFNISVQAVNDPPSFLLGSNSDLELDEDGIGNSVENWVSSISKGPIDEVNQILSFNMTSSKSDSTIFSVFPQIDELSGRIEYSINSEFNGKAQITINLSDDGGTENGGEDTSEDTIFEIWVHQINDIPKIFEIYPRVFEYAKDTTTFYFNMDVNNDTTDIFYRLPYQSFAPPEQPDSLLKFSWAKNDSLDVDTYATWNLDSLFTLYYRLEGTPSDNSKTFVLRDNIDSQLFMNVDSVSVEIDMTAEFPVYSGVFNPDSLYVSEHLDTTGVTEYSWRVVAQNYAKDRLDNDPARLVLSDVDLKIDLELPSAEMSFFQSELYSEYYDLYFITNEETIDSVARVWIDVDAYTQNLFPSKMGDSLYHITSTFVSTGMVRYNFQVRDKQLNLGRSLDTVNYEILLPELARTISSPDHILEMYVPKHAVGYETPVIILVANTYEELSKNNIEVISRRYQITANSMMLLKPATLSFRLLENFTEETLYKYQIVKIKDNDIEELNTYFDGEFLLAPIMSAGNYAVVYNSEAIKPLPEKFALGNIYPNPFNPSTTIEFSIPDENMVMIDIYNLRGQHVLNLLDEKINPGYHSLVWDGLDNSSRMVPAGIYFIKIKFANQLMSRKVTFLK